MNIMNNIINMAWNNLVFKSLKKQIDDLANFIITEIEGEPSRSEPTVTCAIRLLSEYQATIQELQDELLDVKIALHEAEESIEMWKKYAKQLKEDDDGHNE